MSFDEYCYPNGCLKNRLGIQNQQELNKAERSYSDNRVDTALPKGNFDYGHLKAIHYHLFQDVYDWAGQERTVDIAKGDLFCLTPYINSMMDNVSSRLKADNHLKAINSKEFIPKLTDYFADINAIHPFREGNGRATRAFFYYLAQEAGYKLDFSKINQKEWLTACIDSMNTDNKKLEAIFAKITSPMGKEKNIKHKESN